MSTLAEEMLYYFNLLTEAEQKSVLHMVITFAIDRQDFKPQTIEEYNRELEEANERIEAGDFVTHEEVMKKYLG